MCLFSSPGTSREAQIRDPWKSWKSSDWTPSHGAFLIRSTCLSTHLYRRFLPCRDNAHLLATQNRLLQNLLKGKRSLYMRPWSCQLPGPGNAETSHSTQPAHYVLQRERDKKAPSLPIHWRPPSPTHPTMPKELKTPHLRLRISGHSVAGFGASNSALPTALGWAGRPEQRSPPSPTSSWPQRP